MPVTKIMQTKIYSGCKKIDKCYCYAITARVIALLNHVKISPASLYSSGETRELTLKFFETLTFLLKILATEHFFVEISYHKFSANSNDILLRMSRIAEFCCTHVFHKAERHISLMWSLQVKQKIFCTPLKNKTSSTLTRLGKIY